MRIVIRTDASVRIGTGHLMRCLTLAGRLRERSCEILFICRELPGNLCNLIEEKGYKLHRLPYDGAQRVNENNAQINPDVCADWLGVSWKTDAEQTLHSLRTDQPADWIIADHYALDYRWERMMRPHTRKIMVIDDLADRVHDCDLLLDQNLFEDMETRYDGLVPDHCLKFLGPQYALLRPEFIEARKNLRPRNGSVKRIFIFFGGADPTNETDKALEAIRSLNRPDIAVDVVVGVSNPRKGEIMNLCSFLRNVNYYCQVNNMAELMSQADLAIGAGGTTTWERCFLGLPTITIIVAENQKKATTALAKKGAAKNAGWHENVSPTSIVADLEGLLGCAPACLTMSKIAMDLMGTIIEHNKDAIVNAICGREHAGV